MKLNKINFKKTTTPHTIIVEDFKTPLSPRDRSSNPKLNREIPELTDVMNQMDQQVSTEHFTQTQKDIPSSQHLLEPSPKLTTYSATKQVSTDTKKIEITPCFLSDYHRLKLDFNNRQPTNS